MWAGRLLQHRTHIGLWHSSEGERTVALPLRQKKKNSSTFGDNPSCGCESTLRNTDSRQRVAHNNLRILQWKTYSISGTRFRIVSAHHKKRNRKPLLHGPTTHQEDIQGKGLCELGGRWRWGPGCADPGIANWLQSCWDLWKLNDVEKRWVSLTS